MDVSGVYCLIANKLSEDLMQRLIDESQKMREVFANHYPVITMRQVISSHFTLHCSYFFNLSFGLQFKESFMVK